MILWRLCKLRPTGLYYSMPRVESSGRIKQLRIILGLMRGVTYNSTWEICCGIQHLLPIGQPGTLVTS